MLFYFKLQLPQKGKLAPQTRADQEMKPVLSAQNKLQTAQAAQEVQAETRNSKRSQTRKVLRGRVGKRVRGRVRVSRRDINQVCCGYI